MTDAENSHWTMHVTFNVVESLNYYGIAQYKYTLKHAHAHRVCISVTMTTVNRHGGQYACAQPNVGVSSAVFRSGLSCVQWRKVPRYVF